MWPLMQHSSTTDVTSTLNKDLIQQSSLSSDTTAVRESKERTEAAVWKVPGLWRLQGPTRQPYIAWALPFRFAPAMISPTTVKRSIAVCAASVCAICASDFSFVHLTI